MKLHFPSRRPSASLIVASLALFISLGGVGYAAANLPKNSVGTDQIRNNAVRGSKIPVLAVGWRKIQLNAVGIARINSSTVQARVKPTCAGNSAMSAIDQHGNPTCNPTGSKEFGGSSTSPTNIAASATTVTSKALPANSSYMVFANPQVDVSGTTANSQIEVDCSLAVNPGDPSTTQTRAITFRGTGTSSDHLKGSLALMVPAPSVANGSTAAVSCTQTSATGTTVAVSSSVNALQTASNG